MKDLGTIITAILSVGGVILRFVTKKKVKKTADDSVQDELIKTLIERVNALETTKSELVDFSKSVNDKLDLLIGKVGEFESDRNAKKKVERLKDKINDVGLSYITAATLNSSMQAMILDGCAKTGELFGQLLSNGIFTTDLTLFKIRAIAALKAIRSQYVGTGFSSEFSTKIKEEVAYPLLEQLAVELEMIRRGTYNGHSEEKFEEVCLDFVKGFIHSSIKIYTNDIR